ncbi:hypothetical protein MRX96_037506 [Rhipicephalus microplus]
METPHLPSPDDCNVIGEAEPTEAPSLDSSSLGNAGRVLENVNNPVNGVEEFAVCQDKHETVSTHVHLCQHPPVPNSTASPSVWWRIVNFSYARVSESRNKLEQV